MSPERLRRLEARRSAAWSSSRSSSRSPTSAPCRRARRSRGTTASRAGAASASGRACRSALCSRQAKLKPDARYIVFYCADDLGETGDGAGRYYEIDRARRRLPPADHPRLRDERPDAAGPARRAAPAARRAAARLQDGEIRDADRGGRRASPPFAAATAASGKTAATSGTPGSDPRLSTPRWR